MSETPETAKAICSHCGKELPANNPPPFGNHCVKCTVKMVGISGAILYAMGIFCLILWGFTTVLFWRWPTEYLFMMEGFLVFSFGILFVGWYDRNHWLQVKYGEIIREPLKQSLRHSQGLLYIACSCYCWGITAFLFIGTMYADWVYFLSRMGLIIMGILLFYRGKQIWHT